jgi:1,2-diacylglycerol 3-beta-galactosyltransferase
VRPLDGSRALAQSRAIPQMGGGGLLGFGSGASGSSSLGARVRSQLSRLRRIGGWSSKPADGNEAGRLGAGGGAGAASGGAEVGAQLEYAAVAGLGAFPTSSDKKRKVLFLISDTGGGHRASALAVRDALEELYPGAFECVVHDIWTHNSTWPMNTCVDGYRYLAKRPWLWRLCWQFSVFPLSRGATTLACQAVGVVDRFEACFAAEQPSLVVSMHPLLQDLPLKALAKLGQGTRRVPFVTVVTDLGSAHPHWFDKRVDRCFVPSETLRAAAKRRGLTDAQLRMYGLPIRPSFWQSPKGKALSKRALAPLGFRADLETVLVVGGGDGVGSIDTIVSSVAKACAQRRAARVQVVVCCGRNDELRAQLAATKWPRGVHVIVHGFTSQMSDFMACADVCVTKAGPGTIVECAARGLPVVISSYLPGQEAGNVEYVTKTHQFGIYRNQVRTRRIAAAGPPRPASNAPRASLAHPLRLCAPPPPPLNLAASSPRRLARP